MNKSRENGPIGTCQESVMIEKINKYLDEELLEIFYGQPIREIYVSNGRKNECQLLTSVSEETMSNYLFEVY
jgi:hypothetical protein